MPMPCRAVIVEPFRHRRRRRRRPFVVLSVLLAVVGCAVALAAVALPAWQVLDLPELSAVHEHSVFYDCIRSEVTPLDRLIARDATLRGPSRNCAIKMDQSLIGEIHLLRSAVEDGDLRARELLSHRFLPQHKAVLFFSVFTVLFALISAAAGIYSSNCFVPNAVIHLASICLATCCSLLADVIFFIGANRDENRQIPGPMGIHQQHLSYAFFVHVLASSLLVSACLCSAIACYFLLLKQQILCAIVGQKLGQRNVTKRRQKDDGHPWNNGEGGGGITEQKRSSRGDNFFLSAAALRYRSDSENSSFSDRLPPAPPTPQLFQTQNWQLLSFMERRGTVGMNTVNGGGHEGSAV